MMSIAQFKLLFMMCIHKAMPAAPGFLSFFAATMIDFQGSPRAEPVDKVYGASALIGRHLYSLMRWLPMALGAVTLAMLGAGHVFWAVGLLMVAWGAVNSAIPVCWSTWLSKGIADEPDSGGGLMVAAIQLAIMLGGAFGGFLLDRMSITATMMGGIALLILASVSVGNGSKMMARAG